ncbi:MAG: D-alanyl-D-alanine carboxypeptidase/D-alanyl-D-alanine-endopeptidase [Pseudomonadota bacterium]
MRRLLAFVFMVSFLAGSAVSAQDEPPLGLSDRELISFFQIAPDEVGYLVVDLADGAVLASHNPDRIFIPASVAKVPTVIAALGILGGQHRFATGLYTTGIEQGGVLTGDLYLRGGGDPFLSADNLQDLAQRLAARGITRIDGNFFYDASQYIDHPQINPGQPQAAGYNTGVSALSVNFNRIRVRWRNGGGSVTGSASAVTDNLEVPLAHISISTAPADTPAGVPYQRAGSLNQDRWLLSPGLPAEGEDWLPVGNPPLLAAQILRELAADEGVSLPAPTSGQTPLEAREMAVHDSFSLRAISREVLRYSNNMSAELLGLAASRGLTSVALPLAESAEVLEVWLRQNVPAADWTGFHLDNHSGLSSGSRVSPDQMIAMLRFAERPLGGALLDEILREMSWDALDDLNNPLVEVRAKTGTVAYARGLAGYIDAASGRRLAFAVFSTDFYQRSVHDATFDPRQRYSSGGSREWLGRARGLEEELVAGWAARF